MSKKNGLSSVIVTIIMLCLAVNLAAGQVSYTAQIRDLVSQKDYDAAYQKLDQLAQTSPPGAELYYLMAYTWSQAHHLTNLHDAIVSGAGVVVDTLYLNLMRQSHAADPEFDPGKLDIQDDSFLFLSAHSKLTSQYGQHASQYHFMNQPEQAQQMYRLGKSNGAFSNSCLEFNANMLSSCQQNAIIFTNGDLDTFPGWYLQCVAQNDFTADIPPDDGKIRLTPDQAVTEAALQSRNQALHGIRKDITIVNLSLLNTPWFIRYLRDREGVSLDWSDSLIERLTEHKLPRMTDMTPLLDSLFTYAQPDSNGFRLEMGTPNSISHFKVHIPYLSASRTGGAYRASDLAVMKIIRDNFASRPIYFAVTCDNFAGFESYLSNEGLVSRVVPTSGDDQMDIDLMLANADKRYSYRYILDKTIKHDTDMKRLASNYAAAYDRACMYFIDKGNAAKAQECQQKCFQFIDDGFRKDARRIYLDMHIGRYLEAGKITQKLLSKPMSQANDYIMLAKIWYANDPDLAFQILDKAVKQFPEDESLAEFIYAFGLQTQEFRKARQALEKCKPQPGDETSTYIKKLRQME